MQQTKRWVLAFRASFLKELSIWTTNWKQKLEDAQPCEAGCASTLSYLLSVQKNCTTALGTEKFKNTLHYIFETGETAWTLVHNCAALQNCPFIEVKIFFILLKLLSLVKLFCDNTLHFSMKNNKMWTKRDWFIKIETSVFKKWCYRKVLSF